MTRNKLSPTGKLAEKGASINLSFNLLPNVNTASNPVVSPMKPAGSSSQNLIKPNSIVMKGNFSLQRDRPSDYQAIMPF